MMLTVSVLLFSNTPSSAVKLVWTPDGGDDIQASFDITRPDMLTSLPENVSFTLSYDEYDFDFSLPDYYDSSIWHSSSELLSNISEELELSITTGPGGQVDDLTYELFFYDYAAPQHGWHDFRIGYDFIWEGEDTEFYDSARVRLAQFYLSGGSWEVVPSAIPDASVMYLLGSACLIGFGVSRKKYKK